MAEAGKPGAVPAQDAEHAPSGGVQRRGARDRHTLLVLDITVRPPGGLADVLREWPAYLAHIVSFLTIGAVWLAHTTLTEVLARTDQILQRLNLLLLLAVSFLPSRPGWSPTA